MSVLSDVLEAVKGVVLGLIIGTVLGLGLIACIVNGHIFAGTVILVAILVHMFTGRVL